MSDVETDDPRPDEGNVDKTRRRLLVGSTAVVGGIGVAGAAIPFVKSWNPSAKARALGAPIEVDISKLNPGRNARSDTCMARSARIRPATYGGDR